MTMNSLTEKKSYDGKNMVLTLQYGGDTSSPDGPGCCGHLMITCNNHWSLSSHPVVIPSSKIQLDCDTGPRHPMILTSNVLSISGWSSNMV